MTKLMITEGIAGMWHYHLSLPSRPYVGLCGRRTMPTLKPYGSWNQRFVIGRGIFAIRTTFCVDCNSRQKPYGSWSGPFCEFFPGGYESTTRPVRSPEGTSVVCSRRRCRHKPIPFYLHWSCRRPYRACRRLVSTGPCDTHPHAHTQLTDSDPR